MVEGRRATCDELGLPPGGKNTTIDSFDVEPTGYMSATFTLEEGFTSTIYANSNVPSDFNHWGLTSTVKPDASTMTVDAIILSDVERSLVFRFEPAEFYIRNMAAPFAATDIQICGYRPGRAASPPPPPPETSLSLSCGAGETGITGSTAAPGPAVGGSDVLGFSVNVTPAPLDGVQVAMYTLLQTSAGETSFGTTHLPLTNGAVSGTYPSPGMNHGYGTFELRFSVAGHPESTCSLFWNIAEPDAGSGGPGKTW